MEPMFGEDLPLGGGFGEVTTESLVKSWSQDEEVKPALPDGALDLTDLTNFNGQPGLEQEWLDAFGDLERMLNDDTQVATSEPSNSNVVSLEAPEPLDSVVVEALQSLAGDAGQTGSAEISIDEAVADLLGLERQSAENVYLETVDLSKFDMQNLSPGEVDSVLSSGPSSPASYTSDCDPAWSPSSEDRSLYSSSSKRGSPYSRKSPPKEEKKVRKMKQNREAATRYREKKRAEQGKIKEECDELESKNKVLRDRVGQISREIKYLKELMCEVYKTKGTAMPALLHQMLIKS